MRNKNEQGRTMLEMLGVLAIMGIIVYGAIAGINHGMESYKITQAYNEIQDIAQGVEDLYSWSKGYPVTMMENLCKNDIFPEGCLSNGRTAMGQFGGNIQVYGTGGGPGGCPNGLCPTFQIAYILGASEEDAQDIFSRLSSLDWAKSGLCKEDSMQDNAIIVSPCE